jgi:hypothetical protein
MTFIKFRNECLIITLLLCKCTNTGDVCMNICVHIYVCENDLWWCLDKNIPSNGHCVSGSATNIESSTGRGHTKGGAGR